MRGALDLDGPHWRFALEIYAKPGVGAACLRLQDEFGVDVNVLLVALYAATRLGIVVGAEEAAALDAAAAAWRRRAVGPLRALRRDLKSRVEGVPPDAADRLREGVKDLELEAERIEQAVLARVLDGLDPGARHDAAAALEAVTNFYAPGRLVPADVVETITKATA